MLLFSRDLGGAGRPPLVLLHGMLGSSRNWQTAGRDLAEKCHVFALDLRNHGRSPHAAEMTYAAMAADVIAWLDAHGLARVTLLGHSMGGKVAMLLACRHPERVAALLVVDIAPKGYFWPAHRVEFAALNALDLASLPSRAAADRQLETQISHWGMRKFLLTNLEQTAAGHWRWSINLPVLTAALAAMEANPLGPGDRFAGAALFITGDRSPYVAPGDHAAIREKFPAARIVTLPAGHNPHTEAREAFVALVLASAQ
jgi:esterase